MSTEQRHFTRIPFNTIATVIHSRTAQKFNAELIDISLKGLLIAKPDNWSFHNGDHFTVHIQLAKNEIEINLAVIAVHSENNHIGLKTEHMDLDSATHLHRLVELNLGDESLLERELSELVHH
ncbi:MAG: PilZ domain-containing protein [Gammaproteobacteria bacterium]|nr:PilZ domain-containing protein [Gammaproteobacteria bacterium]